MRPLNPRELEEVRGIAEQAALERETALALAAELRALRRLHYVCLHRRPRITIELERLPREPADVAAFRAQIRESLGVSPREPGEDDLVSAIQEARP